MSPRALRPVLMAVSLVLPVATHAEVNLPALDLEVSLEPHARMLEVTATLSAEAGETPVHWQLAARAGVDPALLTLPASPYRRSRVLRYTLALDATKDLSHRDTLGSLSATAHENGSFLPASSLWHPSPVEDGAFTYRLRLTLPQDQRGLVAGRLESESIENARYVARFIFDHPAQGIDLMAGPYAIDERVLERPKGVRVRTYFHTELQPLARDYLEAAAGYIARYSDEIGDYPYTEFSIVSSPTPTGFGMPTLTYLGIDVLKLPFIRHTSLGHEVLHNWWGNGVLVDYARGNWCEGLTTFMADYAYKEREGAEAARQMRLAWLRDLSALPEDHSAPLRAFVSRTHGASQIVGYNKAAMLFFTLRDRLGVDTFRGALRAFWQRHQFRTATWADLQTQFEAFGGQPLERIFSEALDRGDLAAPALVSAHAGADGATTVTLRQPSPPYRLRVPLRAQGDFGEQDFVVDLTAAEQSFRLTPRARPARIALDPELRLLRRLSEAEQPAILRQVMIASRVQLLTPDSDNAIQTTARSLAERILDAELATQEPAARLLIGTHAAVDIELRRLGQPRPAALHGKGTAQAWATHTSDRLPLVVVSARDAAALQVLSRPLPHYGAQSFLAFDGGKVIERGQWPAHSPSIEVR